MAIRRTPSRAGAPEKKRPATLTDPRLAGSVPIPSASSRTWSVALRRPAVRCCAGFWPPLASPVSPSRTSDCPTSAPTPRRGRPRSVPTARSTTGVTFERPSPSAYGHPLEPDVEVLEQALGPTRFLCTCNAVTWSARPCPGPGPHSPATAKTGTRSLPDGVPGRLQRSRLGSRPS
jgi:hypothetical protein